MSRSNIYFESLTGDNPAASSSHVLRDAAAGSQFQSAVAPSADAPAAAYEPVAQANPPAAAGNESRRHSRSPSNAARAGLERGQFAQAAIDIIAVCFALLFLLSFGVAVFGALFILFFVA